ERPASDMAQDALVEGEVVVDQRLLGDLLARIDDPFRVRQADALDLDPVAVAVVVNGGEDCVARAGAGGLHPLSRRLRITLAVRCRLRDFVNDILCRLVEAQPLEAALADEAVARPAAE